MNLLDLYEGREPYQQSIDRLEQRRIEDLEAKMDEYARRGMKDEFQKCKAERDSYHKVKMDEGSMKQWLWKEAERMDKEDFISNADEYGMTAEEAAEWWDDINGVDESSIGQDIVNKTEKMARATPQSKAGAVASTVKNAAKWLAGKGGPGKEGPTYEGTDSQWSKESDWKAIPKAKSGRPADPRGEVTHLSDVARREAERNAAQKKNSKEVKEENSKPRDLAAAVMLKKARAAFPSAQDDAEALALWIAAKEQRDVDHLEHENEQEEEMIARIMDQLKKTGVDEEQKPAGWGEFPPKQEIKIDPPRKLKSGETHQGINDYWKAQGQAPIYKTNEAGSPAQQAAIAIAMKRAGKKPKSVDEESNYGSRPQDMLNYDNNELRALRKFVVKKLLPSGVRGSKKTAIRAEYLINSLRTNMGLLDPKFNSREMYKSHTEATERDVRRVRKELYQLLAPYGFQAVEQGVAEAQTDYQKRRQRERDVDAGKPVTKQRQPRMTDYQKKRAQDKKDMELGEEKTRLDPKCWTGKKIGSPKTKVKGGVRVNNCVPAEESYTGVMESQGITDPKLLEVARKIDLFAKTIK